MDEYLIEGFEQTKGKGLPLDEAFPLLYQILQGLNDAHKADVIHGDIKPANVRFGEGATQNELGSPKLADFGAAIMLRQQSPALRGSTNWMAPEIIKGGDATSSYNSSS